MKLTVVRRLVRLFALGALGIPAGCVHEEDPRPFSTDDSCEAGSSMSCTCEMDGGAQAQGKRSCPSSGHYYDNPCRCAGGNQ